MNHTPTSEGLVLVLFFVFPIHLENPRAWAPNPSNEHGKLCRGCSCSGIPAQLSSQLPPEVLGWGHSAAGATPVRAPGHRHRARLVRDGLGAGCAVRGRPTGGSLVTSLRGHSRGQCRDAPGAVPVCLIPALRLGSVSTPSELTNAKRTEFILMALGRDPSRTTAAQMFRAHLGFTKKIRTIKSVSKGCHWEKFAPWSVLTVLCAWRMLMS